MRRLLVVALAATLLAVPGVAHADPAACPEGLPEVTGTNPSYAEISALIEAAADSDPVLKIPPQVLKAIAYQESRWMQYDPADSGKVIVSSAQADAVCGVGIMQVTAADDPEPMRLATDIAYNIARGAAILREKWLVNQAANNDPDDNPVDDDPAVTENWYVAVCRYNGPCDSSDAYAARVAETVADPFRRVTVAGIKPYMPIKGFTKPKEADDSYAFPGAFQARLDPDVFVFYDEPTGDVIKTVPALTHHYQDPSPAVSYGLATYGPDGPGVSCEPNRCAGWRLLEGKGFAGRAHYTLGVTGAEGAKVTWAPALPRTGAYRVVAHIPAIGTELEPLGNATYHLAGTTSTFSQHIWAGQWRTLGTHTLSPGSTVWLNDVSDEAGKRLVADAMRFTAITALAIAPSTSLAPYGTSFTLGARLTHGGAGVPGKPIRLYRRTIGTTAWSPLGTHTTNATGHVAITVKPSYTSEYTARYTGDAAYTEAWTPNARVNVRPRITATMSPTTAPRRTAVTIKTTLAPNLAGKQVVLQRKIDGVWRNVTSKTLSSSSAATFTVTPWSPGAYYYRVLYVPKGTPTTTSAASATMTLRVT